MRMHAARWYQRLCQPSPSSGSARCAATPSPVPKALPRPMSQPDGQPATAHIVYAGLEFLKFAHNSVVTSSHV